MVVLSFAFSAAPALAAVARGCTAIRPPGRIEAVALTANVEVSCPVAICCVDFDAPSDAKTEVIFRDVVVVGLCVSFGFPGVKALPSLDEVTGCTATSPPGSVETVAPVAEEVVGCIPLLTRVVVLVT